MNRPSEPLTALDVSQNEVDLFTSTLRAKGSPWGDGCASLIQKLWTEVQERRVEVERYKAWAASCDSTPLATTPLASKTVTLSADDLDSLWTALEYTRATVAQNNWAGRSAEQTEWALVHAGRASSSERFMRTWIERVDALRKGVQNSPAETEEKPVEVWNGTRKVSVYADEIMRCGGEPNEAVWEPRTLESVQKAMDWLYSSAETKAPHGEPPHCPNCSCGLPEGSDLRHAWPPVRSAEKAGEKP